jgi:hypothetical protein
VSRNDAIDFAQRLYERVPANYRAYDAEIPQDFAMLALLRVVGEQAANLREDLDDLWDDFFIETAADWVVPYLGALVGTNLLPEPVEQGDRMEVANTVRWRRSRGTPAMLRSLARSVTGWPVDLAEYFQHLGWSQNVNHLRLDDPLSPDLGDTYALARLGRADDPASHAVDIRVPAVLDAPRHHRSSVGVGQAAWGTPGRYGIRELGFLFRRLLTFRLQGVTPAADDPRLPTPTTAAAFTFDPLHHDGPLFVEASREPLTRAAFEHAPWTYLGTDVGVRECGVLLASDAEPAPDAGSGEPAFTFGNRGNGLALDPAAGIRLVDTGPFEAGEPHFLIEAVWLQDDGAVVVLGTLITLLAASGAASFHPGAGATGPGRLAFRVLTGRPIPGASSSGSLPVVPTSPAGRFPGAVVAIRAAADGWTRATDARYAYLPPASLRSSDAPADQPFDPAGRGVFHVAADGSTYRIADFTADTLARPSEGQVYPPRTATASILPARDFGRIARQAGRLASADPIDARPAGAYLLDEGLAATPALYQLELYTGTFQVVGAIATVDRQQSDHAELEFAMPGPTWPALSYAARRFAEGDDPESGLLAVHITPLPGGGSVPETELVVVNRAGRSLLVYLPEFPRPGLPLNATGVRFFVADDGSTHLAPTADDALAAVQEAQSFAGLPIGRASFGQVLPIPGLRPLQQRRPVAVDLCAPAGQARLRPGELGIDPERGRFAFANGDPSIGARRLTVDYVEAFSDRIGARTFDRSSDAIPTRVVTELGDAPVIPRSRVYRTLAEAFASAGDGGATEEVIEIADSATYVLDGGLAFDRLANGRVTLRAAEGRRPCILLRPSPVSSPPSSPPPGPTLRFTSRLERLELSGLLVSGGPVHIAAAIDGVLVSACTLDPRTTSAVALLITDADRNSGSSYLICRSICGGLVVGDGVADLTVADSIIDRAGDLAIGGPIVRMPPASPPDSPPASPLSAPLEPAMMLRSRRVAVGQSSRSLDSGGMGRPPVAGELAESPIRTLHLERVTVLGRIRCEVLEASECLLDDVTDVEDQQAGCIRFSRYEVGSTLPRRYQCVPSDEQFAAWIPRARCEAPLFGSRTYGRPDYVQLAARTPDSIRNASERRSEVGAFTGRLDTLRRRAFAAKTQEFLPVGLTARALAET